jgi:hypothetical protein
LVSKKLAGIRLVSVELEIGGETSAERAKAFQKFVASRLARDAKLPPTGNVDFDLVSLLQSEHFDHDGGKPNRKAVPPFGDLHASLRVWIYNNVNVYPDETSVKKKGRCRFQPIPFVFHPERTVVETRKWKILAIAG